MRSIHSSRRYLLVVTLVLALLVPLLLPAPVVRAQPSPPVLFTPGDGSTTTAQSGSYPPTGTPTLVWFPCTGANLYTVQICPSSGCASPTVSRDTYNTRFAYETTLADGTWYWRVRCRVGTEWSAFSSPYSFTKSWLDYGALAPTLLQPTNDATVEFFEGEIFSWAPVIGAAFYRFEIFNQLDCQGTAVYTRDTLATQHTPQSRRARGDYWWRVTPVDHRNHQGTASLCWRFFMDFTQKPTLLAPADNSTLFSIPEFHWTATRGTRDYHLQVATSPDFTTIVLDARIFGTRYTPVEPLENDKDLYWRVAARDTVGTEGPWSPASSDPDPERVFHMAWHLVPPQLTPTYNFLSAPYPVFQWTPVVGAQTYWFQMDNNSDFSSPMINATTDPNPYYVHTGALSFSTNTDYYWRVKAKDGKGNESLWSQTGLFQFDGTPAPTLIYPSYYYDPAIISATQFFDVRTDPIVPVPVFMWDRAVDQLERWADSYWIEVDTSPLFPAPLWMTRTENLSIAPSLENGFNLPAGTYYWHVRGYLGGVPMTQFSEPWYFKFDPQQQSFSATVFPIFPADATDSVYDTPLFRWSPLQNAARYHFQIGTSATDFSDPEDEAYPIYGFYTPQQRLGPETYYWRVRAQDAGGGYIGDWSPVRRVVITYPLRRGSPTCTPGPCPTLSHPILNEASATRVGSDPAGDAYGSADYELTNLYLARDDATSNSFWFITLDLPPTNTTPMYFAVYVDLDHKADSGGASDPKGFSITTDSIYRPERAFYAYHNSSDGIDLITLYRSQGTGWQPEECLGTSPYPGCTNPIGGGWTYDPHTRYLEIKIPLNVLDLGETWLGTVSLEAFTVPSGSGSAYDTVPSEPAGSPAVNLANFTAAADKVNLLHPWDNPTLDPTLNTEILHTNPFLSFAKPLYRWWTVGYQVQVATDYEFTNLIVTGIEWVVSSPHPQYWFLPTRWGQQDTFPETDSLYWRIRIKHCTTGCYSPWSQPMRFVKEFYVPETMTAEYPYTVPTLQWDRVEGALRYLVEVDDDAGFGSVNASMQTMGTSWTTGWLPDRVWYWRIRVQDAKNRWSNYKNAGSFERESPTTVLIEPVAGAVVNQVPTLSWRYVVTPTENPLMAAPKYQLIVDNEPNFSVPYYWNVTLDTTTFTPDTTHQPLPDGDYWWKVALIPNSEAPSNLGPWSATETFYKAYPVVTPVSSDFDPSADLQWQPQAGAGYYQLEVCRDAAWTDCVERDVKTDQTTYVSAAKYTPGTYYWRARMCDHQGMCGPYYEEQVGPRGRVYLPLVMKRKSLDR